MIVLHARPSPGFRAAVDAIFGQDVVVHVDEAAPLDGVAGEITALLHVLTPVTPAPRTMTCIGVGCVHRTTVRAGLEDELSAAAEGR